MYTLIINEMATIQSKISRGNKYWYIVESRRVKGKPRPIVLEYLGKASQLLKRLEGITEGLRLRSYSHGLVAGMLKVSEELNIVELINKYIKSTKPYRSEKPIYNGLTGGATLLLGAIGRVCQPTSKQSWKDWAKTTSIQYLLKISVAKLDSQHFWDMMDCLPEENIEKLEQELIKRVLEKYPLKGNTLFFDTTNFQF